MTQIGMNTVRLIALDMDRTLLSDDRRLSAANHNALTECVSRGITIAICSGRDLPATRAITDSFDFPLWLLIQNGSLVISPDGSAVRINTMTRTQAERVLSVLDEFGLPPVVYDVHPRSDHVWWQKDAYAAPGVLEFRRDHGSVIEFVDDMRTVLQADISHMEVFGTHTDIFGAAERFSQEPDVVTIANMSSSSPDKAFMGIYPSGTSKEAALENLCVELGISADEVMAIGDNLNDVGMVQWAGIGVMVANGPPQAREAADWIAPSNNESGVAAAIRRYVLDIES